MNGPGMGGSARPKARAGDFERAWEVIVAAGGDKETRDYAPGRESVGAADPVPHSSCGSHSMTSRLPTKAVLARGRRKPAVLSWPWNRRPSQPRRI